MTTTFLEVKNNAKGVLADPLAAGASSLALETGDGAAFPATCPFDITIDGEILRCTERTGDTLTVARGSQGTTPAAHAAGAPVRLNVTAGHLTDLYNAVNGLEAGLNGHQVADGQVIRFGGDGEFTAGLNETTGELEVKDESGNLIMALGPDGALSAASGEFSEFRVTY